MNTNSRGIAALGVLAGGILLGYGLPRLFRPQLPDGKPAEFPTSGGDVPVVSLVTSGFDVTDAQRVMSSLARLQGKTVILLIHTLGASILPVVQIVRAVQRHGRVVAFIPYHALSGGTMVALAASKIFMWPDASLGPVDPQLGPFSASSLLSVLQSKPIETVEDSTVALAHEATKAVKQTTDLVRELVDNEATVARLVSGGTTHSFPISVSEAQQLGIPVQVAQQNEASLAIVRSFVPAREREGGGLCRYELR